MNIFSILSNQITLGSEIIDIEKIGIFKYPSSYEFRIMMPSIEKAKEAEQIFRSAIKKKPSRLLIKLKDKRIAIVAPVDIKISSSSDEKIFMSSGSEARFDPYDIVNLNYVKRCILKIMCKKVEISAEDN